MPLVPVWVYLLVEWIFTKIYTSKIAIAALLIPFLIWLSGLTRIFDSYISSQVSLIDPRLSGLLGLAGFYDAFQIILLVVPAVIYVTAVKISVRLASSTSGKLTA